MKNLILFLVFFVTIGFCYSESLDEKFYTDGTLVFAESFYNVMKNSGQDYSSIYEIDKNILENIYNDLLLDNLEFTSKNIQNKITLKSTYAELSDWRNKQRNIDDLRVYLSDIDFSLEQDKINKKIQILLERVRILKAQ